VPVSEPAVGQRLAAPLDRAADSGTIPICGLEGSAVRHAEHHSTGTSFRCSLAPCCSTWRTLPAF